MIPEVKDVEKLYLGKELNVEQAIDTLDWCVGGIRAAHYKPGKKLRIVGDDESHSLRHRGLRKRQLTCMEKLVARAYLRAIQNGSADAGGVHLGKGRSSKHYFAQLQRYAA